MYSPKIAVDLIPSLYRLAKDRKVRMTKLVDGIIRNALAGSVLPESSDAESRIPASEPRNAAA